MKKKMAILMTALVGTMAFALVGCKTKIGWIDKKICKHEYEFVEITLEPTCTEEGERLMECVDCGKQKTETMEKIPHNEVVTPGKDPTCTEDGYTEKVVCSVCQEVLIIPKVRSALGHTDNNGDCKCDTCDFSKEAIANLGEGVAGNTYRLYPAEDFEGGEAYTYMTDLILSVTLLDGSKKSLYVTVCGEMFSSTSVSGFVFEDSICKDSSGNVMYRDVTFKVGTYTAVDYSGEEFTFLIDETTTIENVTNFPGNQTNQGYVTRLESIISEA